MYTDPPRRESHLNRSRTPQPDPPLLVLHALRCAGACGLARLRAVTGLEATRLDFVLIDHTVDGLTARVSDDPPCWQLTDAGRAEHARLLAEELTTAGTRASVEAAFDRFLVLNPELLDLCTAWQLRTVDGVTSANDTATRPTTHASSTGSPTSTGAPRPSAPNWPRRSPASAATASGSPKPSTAPPRARWST